MSLLNTIVVSGKAEVGKTTSLKMFVEEPSKRDNVVIEDSIPFQKKDNWCSFNINEKKNRSYHIWR